MTTSRLRSAGLASWPPGHQPLLFVITVEPSRGVHPEHSENEPGGKDVQAMQPRRFPCEPSNSVEGSENEDHSDPVAGKRTHWRRPFVPCFPLSIWERRGGADIRVTLARRYSAEPPAP